MRRYGHGHRIREFTGIASFKPPPHTLYSSASPFIFHLRHSIGVISLKLHLVLLRRISPSAMTDACSRSRSSHKQFTDMTHATTRIVLLLLLLAVTSLAGESIDQSSSFALSPSPSLASARRPPQSRIANPFPVVKPSSSSSSTGGIGSSSSTGRSSSSSSSTGAHEDEEEHSPGYLLHWADASHMKSSSVMEVLTPQALDGFLAFQYASVRSFTTNQSGEENLNRR